MSRKTITKNISYDDRRDRYYAVFNGGADPCGHRLRRTRTFHTYAEAETALRGEKLLDLPALTACCPPQNSSCTLHQWLEWWMAEERAQNRAASTLYGYRNIIRCHIDPALGGRRLNELTPLLLQMYLRNMQQDLRPNTVRKHYVLLNTVLRRAEALGILGGNPMHPVVPPPKEAGRYTFYSPQQMQALFAAVDGTMMELAVKLAAYLGLRRSEIAGLRWESVDLDRGEIRIREVRTEVGGEEVIKKPKTATSIRRLGISGLDDLCRSLERAHASRRSDDPRENVLLRPDGTPPKPDYLTAQLLAVVRDCGLPHITMHGLRHSFASVANSVGVPMYDISRTLGHSSLTVTSSIYTHLFDETETEAISTVARAIEGAQGASGRREV